MGAIRKIPVIGVVSRWLREMATLLLSLGFSFRHIPRLAPIAFFPLISSLQCVLLAAPGSWMSRSRSPPTDTALLEINAIRQLRHVVLAV